MNTEHTWSLQVAKTLSLRDPTGLSTWFDRTLSALGLCFLQDQLEGSVRKYFSLIITLMGREPEDLRGKPGLQWDQ